MSAITDLAHALKAVRVADEKLKSAKISREFDSRNERFRLIGEAPVRAREIELLEAEQKAARILERIVRSFELEALAQKTEGDVLKGLLPREGLL